MLTDFSEAWKNLDCSFLVAWPRANCKPEREYNFFKKNSDSGLQYFIEYGKLTKRVDLNCS